MADRGWLAMIALVGLAIVVSCGGAPGSAKPPSAASSSSALAAPRELVYRGHAGAVVGIAWSRAGDRLASSGDDHSDQVWVPGANTAAIQYREHRSYEFAVAWSPDGSLLASVGADGQVKIWRSSDGATARTITLSSGQRYSIAWSPDGNRLAVGGDGGPATLWDPATGALGCTATPDSVAMLGVTFSADGHLWAAAGHDGIVRLYDTATCTVRASFTVGQPAWAVAFSPDGTMLAATTGDIDAPAGAGPDGVVVWDLHSGGVKVRLPGNGPTNGVAWIPGGAGLVYGGGLFRNDSGDHDYRVWIADLAGHRQVVTNSHYNTVWSVAVSPDGRLVASASQDGTVVVTPTPTTP